MQILVLAFVVVVASVGLMMPIMLYVFNLQASGWTWQYVGLFVSMLASTDAVAIISTMKTSTPSATDCTGRTGWTCHSYSSDGVHASLKMAAVIVPSLPKRSRCCSGWPRDWDCGCRHAPLHRRGPRDGVGRCYSPVPGPHTTEFYKSSWPQSLELSDTCCQCAGGGAERLRLLMDGEALCNDAHMMKRKNQVVCMKAGCVQVGVQKG